MRCSTVRERIDRFVALGDADRSAVHVHVSDCLACRAYLEEATGAFPAIDALARLRPRLDAGELAARLSGRRRQLRREVAWGAAAAAVSALAVLWFIFEGDTLGRLALTLTTVALVYNAWRTRREARDILVAAGGARGPECWRRELRKELKQVTVQGPLVAASFLAMTAAVALRHGVGDLRTFLFAVVATAITACVVHRFVVRRPVIRRELELLAEMGG